jgi:hypothetical protein
MRLIDLDPRLKGTLEDGVLLFLCPLGGDCPFGPFHTLRVRVGRTAGQQPDGTYRWAATGAYPDTLSLSPSINEYEVEPDTNRVVRQGWHGFIRHGEVHAA